jgi:uncharacterized protein involved in exopolysaccharide biosynthesis/Mrp family chromosome partitioning ATPase
MYQGFGSKFGGAARPESAQGRSYELGEGSADPRNVMKLISAARRQIYLLILGMLLGLAVGALYLRQATPLFSATASILLDATAAGQQDSGQAAAGAPPIDDAQVNSKVELLSSDKTIALVIANLTPENRTKLAETLSKLTGLRTEVSRLIPGNPADTEVFSPDVIRDFLKVNRIERTYVVDISFTSPNPSLAAYIANEFAEAYRELQRDQALEDAKRRVEWFEQRIDETRALSAKADLEVQTFRLSSEVGESDVRRAELAQKAENLHKLYQSLFLRQQEAIEEETYPRNGAQVITPATPPSVKTKPKGSFVLVASMLLGLGVGAVLGTAREMFDSSLRTSGDVEGLGQVAFLGYLPRLGSERASLWSRLSGGAPYARISPEAIYRYSIDHPMSRFSETLRAIRASASLSPPRGESKAIGIVSSLPGDGKSILSLNLARLLAHEGASVLLIDGDPRSRDLSQRLASDATYGLNEAASEVSTDPEAMFGRLVQDDCSGMMFLPILPGQAVHDNNRTKKLEELMRTAKTRFNYVIVDLPPLIAVADARSIAYMVEHFVLVASWGETSKGGIRKLLDNEVVIANHLLGLVLNKTDLARLRYYERDDDVQHHRFRKYYAE